MTGNPRTARLLIVASVGLAGAALGLAIATAVVFAAISLGWPAVDGMLYLGLLGGAAIGGITCHGADEPRCLRLQCILGAASIGAFAGMIAVLGGGNIVTLLLAHERATADFAFDVTLKLLPIAMIGGAIGGAALGPSAERMMTAWSRAMVDRFGHRHSG